MNNHLQKPRPTVERCLEYTPVVVSDSKGNYLLDQVDQHYYPENCIVWWAKSGASTEERYRWIKNNIRDLKATHNKIHIYFWTGTCDLTFKNKKSIHLASREEGIVEDLITTFKKVSNLQEECKGVKVTILEIPFYSIQAWNRNKGLKPREVEEEEDHILKKQIETINKEIRKLNTDHNLRAPRFNLDLQRCRSGKQRGYKTYYINYNLLKDGIHPGEQLAQVWLRNLTTHIIRDC